MTEADAPEGTFTEAEADLSAQGDMVTSGSIMESQALGTQTFSLEQAKHEVFAADRAAKRERDAKQHAFDLEEAAKNKAFDRDQEATKNAQQRWHENIIFGLVIGVVVLMLGISVGFILLSNNVTSQDRAWSMATLITGTVLGGVVGYQTAKRGK